ncbi:hypothetical protein QFZ96_002254 [Paraburkholderia youngii]
MTTFKEVAANWLISCEKQSTFATARQYKPASVR